jgi:hypothetical protein
MKYGILITIVLASQMLMVSQNVLAVPNSLYFGIEALKYRQSAKKHFGENVFGKNPVGLNIFVGFKLLDHCGLEVGYEFDKTKKETSRISTTEPLTSVTPPIAVSSIIPWREITSKINTKHHYIGVVAHNTFWQEIHLSVLAGLSLSKVDAMHILQDDATPGLPTPQTILASHRHFSKTKLVPMVKVAASKDFLNNFGIRTSATWRQLSMFKIHAESSKNQLKMKDSYSAGFGLYYKF